MNIRKIKLALSVGLMNTESNNLLHTVKEQMKVFKSEVGSLLGTQVVKNDRLNKGHVKHTYALRFENCTLDLDLVMNTHTKTQTVQGFQLR